MALVRTDRLLELGGYDCHWLYGLEDWELNQRLFSLGEPMAFVPVLVGKYTTRRYPCSTRHRCRRGTDAVCEFSVASTPSDQRSSARASTILIVGTIWASAGWSSPAARRWRHRSRQFRSRAPSPLKVLVVSSGGRA